MKVSFALPKGSLEKAVFDLLALSGYVIKGQERTYRPSINDPGIELKVLRAQEISVAVAEGLHDVGITGSDWVRETGADVEQLLDLECGQVKLVVAIPAGWSDIDSFSALLRKLWSQGKNVRISTEYLNLAAEYVRQNEAYRESFGEAEPVVVTPWWRRGENPKVSIYLSFGATEAKPPENADAIIDLTQTGTTLEQNNLKVVETIAESSAVLVANKASLRNPEKREKIYDILTLLKGTVEGKRKIHIFVNVREENLDQLLGKLPALKRPTVSPLAGKGWFSVNTVIDREEFFAVLPTLRRLAQGLVVHEPQQILELEEIAKSENSIPNSSNP
ncbi:MAG: ATP phosphoribosyltransferase [Candidatus Bathyarchaeia archaeon]